MPDVHSLLSEAIESKKEAIQVLQQKLDEIKTNSLIDDDIEESYEGFNK
ncbi:MAG: hypothetical protein P8Y79_16245 [Ignavibacteriaceae bacterium]